MSSYSEIMPAKSSCSCLKLGSVSFRASGKIRVMLRKLTLPWSNGQTEGQVNKLKLLKRSMYGRAKLDLLRQRLLRAA